MDSDSIGTIIILVILTLCSAYFSATETAFSSLNRIRVKNLADNGNKRAKKTLKLYENYDKLLSTILIGNNVVNIASASIATVLFVKLLGDKGVTMSTVVMTILVLIFGEITPKSLSKESPEKFAMFSTPIINVIMIVLTPITFLFHLWKLLVAKIFKTDGEHGITEEELLTFVEEAEHEGAIEEEDKELIRSVIEFNDQQVVDILTPRVDIVGVALTVDAKETIDLFVETGYSRLPVFDGSVDQIVGVIHQKDFLKVSQEEDFIKKIIKPVLFIAPTMKISKLLKMLQKANSHIAVVSDEYGGTLGIVTMEDVLEELVGEIWDEHDEVVQEIEKIGENQYKIRCSAELDGIFEYFDKTVDSESYTVSGWIMEQLDRIPTAGDTFDYENMTITVKETDGRRVMQCIVSVRPEDKDDEDDE